MNYYGQYNYNPNSAPPLSPFSGGEADAFYTEKYRCRRAGNALGGALLLQSVILTVLQFGVLAAFMGFGLSYTAAAEKLNSAPWLWLFQGFASVIGLMVAALLCSAFYGMRQRDAVMTAAPERRGETFPLILTFCGALTVANLMSSQFLSVVGYDSSKTDALLFDFPEGFFGAVLSVLVVGIIPALAEEFLYRGVVLGILRNVSDGFAIFASALIFGIMHGNISQIPFAFLLGLALGYMTVRTRSIWPAVLAHGINNTLSVGMDILTRNLSDTSANILAVVYFTVMGAIGVLGIILAVKRGINFSVEKGRCFTPAKTRLRFFLTAPAMVIYLITVVLQILSLELML